MGNQFGRGGGGNDGMVNYRYNANGANLYFGDNFVMGGEEFAALDPEAFLFGDMADLNYLGRMPGAINAPPPSIKHTNTTRCFFYVHKESIRLVSHQNSAVQAPVMGSSESYHVDFTFDADAPCKVTVYFVATEVMDKNGNVTFTAQNSWPTRHFEAGLNQRYSHAETTIDNLHTTTEEDLLFHQGSDKYPVVIHIAADVDTPKQSLSAYATFERSGSGQLSLRPLVQKAHINGMFLVLKEIFGIERKDDNNDNECVVCMSAAKDTMALPCRHLCLCNPCAEVLRFQANKCPICRAAFHSLLQIRVLVPEDEVPTQEAGADPDDDEYRDALNPPGYASISLAEAVEVSSSAAVSPFASAPTPPPGLAGSKDDSQDEDDETDTSNGYLHVTGTLPKNTSTGVGPEELSASTVDNLLKSTFADKRGGGGMGTDRGGGNSSSAALSPPTTHKPADDGTEDDLPNTDG